MVDKHYKVKLSILPKVVKVSEAKVSKLLITPLLSPLRLKIMEAGSYVKAYCKVYSIKQVYSYGTVTITQ